MSVYSHSKKAGNQGDVFKHTVLVELVKHLVSKKAAKASSSNFPFHYLDTHSGAPLHDLTKTTEWQNGIGKFWNADTKTEDLDYFSYVAKSKSGAEKYPSSWMLAYQTLLSAGVPNYKVSLFDTSAEVTHAIQTSPYLSNRIQFECTDAWKKLNKHLKQVDLVFIDPSFSIDRNNGEKSSNDWGNIMKTSEALLKKGIPFVIWYPYFTEKNPRKLTNVTGLTALELVDPNATNNNRVLKGSGMLFGNIDDSFIAELFLAMKKPFSLIGDLTRYN
jgi:23S rRNA A2030 N6-methylase RlmJ